MNNFIYLKSIVNKYSLYDLVVIACVFINITYTHQEIMHLSRWYHIIYPTSHICFFLFEVFSVYFLSFIYPKRRRGLFLFLYFVTTLLLWINVGYSRYFDTYMPLSLYTEFNNLNGLLPNIKDAIEKSDLIFLLTSTIAVAAYYFLSNCPKPKYSFALPILFVGITLVAFLHHYKSVKSDHDHLVEHFKDINDQRTVWDTMVDRRQMMEHNMPKASVNYYGIGLTLFLNILENLLHAQHFSFSEVELKDINKYMYASKYPLPADTTQNLIMIFVESLSSYPINKSFNGIELTPNINKLLSKAYYNPNMTSEALLGESSDGQFIYLTGLLPLKRGVTINEICSQQITTFVSLAKQHKPSLYSQMTIPTDKNAWSQEAMCKKYGIDKLISKEQYPLITEDEWLNDQQLFEFATDNDHELKPPFISFILTSSMHSPYIKSFEDYDIDYPKTFSSELCHYLDNVHYMDKYLGAYLESLKKHEWYNQCTIIITADHKPNGPKLNATNDSSFVSLPLIIFNQHNELKQQDQNEIKQTSIYPTILDILGIQSQWRGVGVSIFAPDSIRDCIYEREREKSRQIISDYLIGKNYL